MQRFGGAYVRTVLGYLRHVAREAGVEDGRGGAVAIVQPFGGAIGTYHGAWTTGDFVTARRCLADDPDFNGSFDAFRNADDFVGALRR